MLLQVTQTASAGPVDAYALFNYHLGSGGPVPGADSESITYDATRDAFYETGPSGVAFAYASIVPSTHHGCTIHGSRIRCASRGHASIVTRSRSSKR